MSHGRHGRHGRGSVRVFDDNKDNEASSNSQSRSESED